MSPFFYEIFSKCFVFSPIINTYGSNNNGTLLNSKGSNTNGTILNTSGSNTNGSNTNGPPPYDTKLQLKSISKLIQIDNLLYE